MRVLAGVGVVLANGKAIPVRYDLVEAAASGRVFAEGELGGDAHALSTVFSPFVQRLETGDAVHAFLADCRSTAGVADIRVTDPIAWTQQTGSHLAG